MQRKTASFAILLLFVGGVYVYQRWSSTPEPRSDSPPAASPTAESSDVGGRGSILEAFAARRSGLMVESGGTVERTLSDDLEGSRHQRFIVRLTADHTLLVSHNIDLAPRVPLNQGDRVDFRGQYEWNERGGVVHWTHHDPDGRRPGGWIRHRGRLFK